MKNRKIRVALLLTMLFVFIFGVQVYAADGDEYLSADGFSYSNELKSGASFGKIAWMAEDVDIYNYLPSKLYDPITSMMPVFYVYPEEPLADADAAWTKLKESGLLDLAEREYAAVYFINPSNGSSYTADDYDQVLTLSKSLTGGRDMPEGMVAGPFGSLILKKLYIVGEGESASFVTDYLTNDVFSGMVSANVLLNAQSISAEKNYAIPTYLIGCSDEVVSFYQAINETDKTDTLDGRTVYYNSKYVMDSGYTPKRVIIGNEDANVLNPEVTENVWNYLLKRVWNDILVDGYFMEGVEGGVVADRPIVDELGLTFNEITDQPETGQSRWYEWVPNEVFATMNNNTDNTTYPLIVVNHGNGDHEIYEAESNGWVQLAGDERVIVVAMKDIFEAGMPPESAKNRYGKENAAFIRDVICKKYPVDMSRIYITGFSIGAFVTAETSSAAPELFAAAAPMAYPADGYMQIFPYETNGTDPEKYDLPVMYMCGRGDQGNTMVHPTDSSKARVMATQLFFNQVLTFNGMTDQLIDLVDFDYDWYPGENDPKTDRVTGEVTGGYDFWDGTAAQYITQNLDFDKYPFYGFDPISVMGAEQDQLTTGEGITYERNIVHNSYGWPMLEFLVMGDMGHNHYNRYAQIIWNDLFKHYTRDPETGALSYDGESAPDEKPDEKPDDTPDEYLLTDEFSYSSEVPENASFGKIAWMADDVDIYNYIPSEVYDQITSMMPVFYVYPEKPLADVNAAWTKLKESGLYDVAEREHAAVYFINPSNGSSYTDKDYDQVLTLSKSLTGGRNMPAGMVAAPYGSIILKKLYVIGEGEAAQFVSNYLTNDIFSGMVAAEVLINSNSVSAEKNYAIPTYLIGCSDDVVDFYRDINETDKEDTLDGRKVYYNSKYVMDSGYTPKRVIIGNENATTLNPTVLDNVWNYLLKRVWTDILVGDYFIEGTEGGVVSDRPIVDELDLTFNEITDQEEETGQGRWYEWVPNEVFDTMKNNTGETYPLIVVNHGAGDHEIYEAESNGWVQLAGDERVIVVAMRDIYEAGMPPESAKTRYGKQNAAFIRDVICKKYPVDMSRIYIAGFSIGAFVTAETSSAAPDLFAAAAPMAYPADGYMQIFPYETNGTDAAQYDLPIMYMCGRGDQGNTMVHPTDSSKARVMATHLFYNQILTFNEMEDRKIDLVDFAYDWYPGENDPKTDRVTGEVTGGYDFWDGTAAQYITQNLDFDKYPFYGFDPVSVMGAKQDQLTTIEGITYDRNIVYNDEGWPMLEFLVMGDMGHNHYNRYAQIIWNDLFKHYTRDPETGILSYDGVESTKIISSVTQAKKDAQVAKAALAEAENKLAAAVTAKEEAEAKAAVAEAAKAAAEAKAAAAEAAAKASTNISVAKVTQKKPVSKKKKQIQISWSKVAGATGYEILVSQKSSMKNAVSTVVSGTKTKATIKKLVSGKKYYIKVRAYKTVNDVTVCGAYSAKKNVKVK